MKSKYLLQIFIVVLILMTIVTDASAKEITVVYGTGDPNIDVAAVQQAVDTSNVVRLRGTFDFGDEGSVSIFNDVEIYGDSATIKNGKQTFAVGFDPSLPDGGDARHQPGFVGPKVVFKNLNFENALYSTIHVLAASGLTVENCTFTDGRYFNVWGLQASIRQYILTQTGPFGTHTLVKHPMLPAPSLLRTIHGKEIPGSTTKTGYHHLLESRFP